MLYRAFSKHEYARQFVFEGRFRLGLLSHYRNIEGPQKDPTEGVADYVDGGAIKNTVHGGNEAYLLCCSKEGVDLDSLAAKGLGRYFVQIEDPVSLASEVEKFLLTNKWRIFGKPTWRTVTYGKGEVLNQQFDSGQKFELAYLQKPPEFSSECEERLVVLPNVSPSLTLPNHLEIDISCRLEYARIVQH
jgi:hypothetical protein